LIRGRTMTIEEIDKVRARKAEIKGNNYAEQLDKLRNLIDELGISRAFSPAKDPKDIVMCYNEIINTHLQTEMMRNICESAEKSCKSAEESSGISRKSCRWAMWAAIASLACAVLTAVSVILMMCS
jgi:hypothetical protein